MMNLKSIFKIATIAVTFLLTEAVLRADQLSVTTATGADGVSGSIQNQPDTSSFGGASFHVKNNGDTTTTRKGYVRFDVSGLDFVPEEGTLSLTVATIDSAIADDDQIIYVYGITNQALDLVALTNGLDWSNAPGNDPDSWHAADLSEAMLLGTFVLDYNGNYAAPVGTVVTLEGSALASFVSADTNGLVTLLIGRRGPGGTDGGSASKNLLFAGDTHASYSPPALTLNTIPQVTTATGATPEDETSATIRGVLTDDNGQSVSAWFCWGENDGGTGSTGNWDHVVSMGTVAEGDVFSAVVSGLTPNRTYWYRCYVSTDSGDAWSAITVPFSGTPTVVSNDTFETSTTTGIGGVSGSVQNQPNTASFGVSSFHVKNNADSTATRKGYVRFDVSGLDFVPLEGTLNLTVATIDSTIADDDQTIYVYGITNQALDEVALINGLDWSSAPGNDPDSWHAADLSDAELLGTFIIDYDGNHAAPAGTVVQLRAPALASFVNADTNGLVTLLLGRTGPGGMDGGSASKNLLFAGDTHASYSPPTLTLDTQPSDRPFIWVRDTEKAGILSKIGSNSWAGSVFADLTARADSAVADHQADRDTYLRGLPVDWSLGSPVFYRIYDDSSSGEGWVRTAIVEYYNRAVDCSVMYYLTGDEKYARCAADILYNSIESFLPLPVSTYFNYTPKGGWLYWYDFLKEARLNGTQMPVVYDFLYNFLRAGNKVYSVKDAAEVTFNFNHAQQFFRTYADLPLDTGLPDNNWPVLESACLVQNALALDNEAERIGKLQYYLTENTPYQDSLAKVSLQYPQSGDTWPESLNYSSAVNELTTFLMVLLERYDPALNLFDSYPNIAFSLSRPGYLRYPNNEVIRFGDGPRELDVPYFYYETVYHHAVGRGYTGLSSMYGELINGGIYIGEYDRATPYTFASSLSPYRDPLQLLWFAPDVEGTPSPIDYPRTDTLPYAGIALQRNMPPHGDPEHGLMCFVGGATHTHAHATGMNMELYGGGEVLGAEGGTGTYGTLLHERYYRLFAAHNTIIVNGSSQGEGPWLGLGINTVQVEAMEPQVFQEAVSSNISFTCTSFEDDRGTQAEADQQRTLAMIRTSPTSGYYVDIFRSSSSLPGEYHDYIYHNIGDTLGFEAGGSALSMSSQPTRFQNDIGDYYDQPGWRYFSNTEVSAAISNDVFARFEASLPAGDTFMDVHMPGTANREYVSCDAPATKDSPSPYNNLNTPTMVVRHQGEAWTRPFAFVYEPHVGSPSNNTVQSVAQLKRGATVVGLKVESRIDDRDVVQYVLSNPWPSQSYTNAAAGLTFAGRFGVVTDHGDGRVSLYLGDGSHLTFGEYLLESAGGTNLAAEARFSPDETTSVTAHDTVIVQSPTSSTVTTNHAVPYAWLYSQNPGWTNDYEAAALTDHDNDGYATWQEYWSGTDPENSNSYLRIYSISSDGSNMVLESVHAQVDSAIPPISVQSSTNLTAGSWTPIGSYAPFDGTNTWTTPFDMAHRFYQLAVTNAP